MSKSSMTVIFTIVKTYFVYILTNKRFTVLYTGVTGDLEQRVYEHKTKFHSDSFTAKYQCDRLVYYEEFETKSEAMKREYSIKQLSRLEKSNLIKDFTYTKMVPLEKCDFDYED